MHWSYELHHHRPAVLLPPRQCLFQQGSGAAEEPQLSSLCGLLQMWLGSVAMQAAVMGTYAAACMELCSLWHAVVAGAVQLLVWRFSFHSFHRS